MKVDKLVPKVYYKESRDFAYIARLFEIVFNYMKMGAGLVKVNLDDKYINSNIIDLGSLSLGFESKHKYITQDYLALISSLRELIRKKGTIDAIDTVVRLLCTSQKLNDKYSIDRDETDRNKIIIKIPSNLKDIILMEDLFDYILPVGTIYTIIFTNTDSNKNENKFTISNRQATARIQENIKDSDLGKIKTSNLSPTVGYKLVEEKPNNWDYTYNQLYYIKETSSTGYIYVLNTDSTWTENEFYEQYIESKKDTSTETFSYSGTIGSGLVVTKNTTQEEE